MIHVTHIALSTYRHLPAARPGTVSILDSIDDGIRVETRSEKLALLIHLGPVVPAALALRGELIAHTFLADLGTAASPVTVPSLHFADDVGRVKASRVELALGVHFRPMSPIAVAFRKELITHALLADLGTAASPVTVSRLDFCDDAA